MNKTKIDYKKRIKNSFETIIKIVESGKNTESKIKIITRLCNAQILNLNGVVNKDNV